MSATALFELGRMRHRRLRWIVLCGLLGLASPASADGISGTYVGKGSNAAFLIQIVETADGHLTGRFEQITLQPDGKLDDMDATIVGAADGQTVVVTIKPAALLAGSLAASGTVQGTLRHLTGGGNGANLILNLLKSDEVNFRAQFAMLTEQGRQIDEARARQDAAQRQAKIETDQLTSLENLTQHLGPVDKPVLAPARSERLVRRDTHVATAVTS
jgi:hypothetical protein